MLWNSSVYNLIRVLTISFFLSLAFSLQGQVQLNMFQNYPYDSLEVWHQQGLKTKDSLQIGVTAYLLSKQLEWRDGFKSKHIGLAILAVKALETTGDSIKIYAATDHLATFYEFLDSPSEAIELYKKAIQFYESTKDSIMLMHDKARLGFLYAKNGQPDLAQQLLKESRNLNIAIKDTILEIAFLIREFDECRKKQLYQKGLVKAREILALSEAINNNIFITLGLLKTGICHYHLGQYSAAIDYLHQTIQTERPISYSTNRRVSYDYLMQSYKATQNYPKALEYAQKYAALNDSILAKGRQKALHDLTLEYEAEKKQAEIEALETENIYIEAKNQQQTTFLWFIGIGAVILATLLGFVLWFYRKKIQQDQIISDQNKALNEQQIQTLERQVQLTAVQSMLEGQESERQRIAQDLHDSLGGLLSTIKLQLEQTQNPKDIQPLLDKAAQEVRNISHHLQPSTLAQFGLVAALKDLVNLYQTSNVLTLDLQCYHVTNLSKSVNLQLYRIIQEALHNAVKHAQATEILIQLNGETDALSIIIEDNGIGFDASISHQGSGLSNMRKRVEFLKGEFTIDSTEVGTSVYIVFPLQ